MQKIILMVSSILLALLVGGLLAQESDFLTRGETYLGHGLPVNDLAWSSDSAQIASAGDDGAVRIWSPQTLTTSLLLNGHTGYVLSVAWSSDDAQVASGGLDDAVWIWDTTTGEGAPLAVPTQGDVWALAWWGDRLAIGDGSGRLILWDSASGQVVATQDAHIGAIYDVAWQGDQLASGGEDGILRIWSRDGEFVGETESLNVTINALSWRTDTPEIAVGALSPSITTWNAESFGIASTKSIEAGGIYSLAYSPTHDLLLVGEDFGGLHLISVSSRLELEVIAAHNGFISDMALSPNGSQLATASNDGTVTLWNLAP